MIQPYVTSIYLPVRQFKTIVSDGSDGEIHTNLFRYSRLCDMIVSTDPYFYI